MQVFFFLSFFALDTRHQLRVLSLAAWRRPIFAARSPLIFQTSNMEAARESMSVPVSVAGGGREEEKRKWEGAPRSVGTAAAVTMA